MPHGATFIFSHVASDGEADMDQCSIGTAREADQRRDDNAAQRGGIGIACADPHMYRSRQERRGKDASGDDEQDATDECNAMTNETDDHDA